MSPSPDGVQAKLKVDATARANRLLGPSLDHHFDFDHSDHCISVRMLMWLKPTLSIYEAGFDRSFDRGLNLERREGWGEGGGDLRKQTRTSPRPVITCCCYC